MESVRGEDCQDPIPATLTLNRAEVQGRDRTDPAPGAGTRPAPVLPGASWAAACLATQSERGRVSRAVLPVPRHVPLQCL